MSNGLPLTSTRALDDWCSEAETFRKAEEAERRHRHNVEQSNAPDWETRFRALDEHLFATIDRRLDQETHTIGRKIIDQMRAELSRELAQAQRTAEAKLASLTDRIEQYRERPGKLPTVRDWRHESVTYANDLVSHDGALWQAKRDTAQKPGGALRWYVKCAGATLGQRSRAASLNTCPNARTS